MVEVIRETPIDIATTISLEIVLIKLQKLFIILFLLGRTTNPSDYLTEVAGLVFRLRRGKLNQ